MIDVRPIPAGATHDLRRRVLRQGTPSADVTYPQDELEETLHLGVFDDESLVGVSTWALERWPTDPASAALRLRGMAVDPTRQGGGFGRALIDDGVARARVLDVDLVWATARDSVLGFYQNAGFVVVGDGFVDAATALAHHVVIRHVVVRPDIIRRP